MSEANKFKFPELWEKWLSNLYEGGKLSLEEFLAQQAVGETDKELLRLQALGGDY